MSYSNINNPANYQLASFGQFGFRLIGAAGSGQAGEHYRVVYALEDSVIAVTAEAGDNLAGQTILAGTAIYGLFSDVTVSTGTVLAYIG